MQDEETKELVLKQNEHFSIRGDNYQKDELFHGVNIFVKNNGNNLVKAVTNGKSVTITIERLSQ